MDLKEKQDHINILKGQKAAFLSAAASLEDAIRILEGTAEKPIDWKNNALDCLRNHSFPLRTVDILNCMFINDPEKLSEPVKRRNYVSALSIALNNLCDKSILNRLTIPGFKGYFYGLKELFFEDGNLRSDISNVLMGELWNNPNSVFKLAERAHLLNPEIYESNNEE